MSDLSAPYKVLANKYRPQTFNDLIGQDILVRTLTNAIERNRIANAFLLTGIRGVGKTTTARIIARALNCIGEDGNGEPTTEPCGVCRNCTSIREDRHPDIMEMDAASRTGVDDIREIIENAHYLPTSARYKIFIIDEVHMLSKNAFNALLKTLEEPPAHVKFIFATTEIQKIPITILSRCQRFDLRRIQIPELAEHLKNIVTKEEASVEEDALRLIASASEGSVRDSLSMLDQAIAQHEGNVTAKHVRDMLGLADHSRIHTLFSLLASGDISSAIDEFSQLYFDGADPTHIFEELMEFNYLITSIKVGASKGDQAPEEQKEKAAEFAEKLDVAYLSRMWQMLLKGLGELKSAPNTLIAGEMLLVRLGYMSGLPSPAKLVESYQKQSEKEAASGTVGKLQTQHQHSAPPPDDTPTLTPLQQNTAAHTSAISANENIKINNFKDLVNIFKEKKEMMIHEILYSNTQLISFKPQKIDIHINVSVAKNFTNKASELLSGWTGQKWIITHHSNQQGEPPLRTQQQHKDEQLKETLSSHPNVKSWLEAFPGTEVVKINQQA